MKRNHFLILASLLILAIACPACTGTPPTQTAAPAAASSTPLLPAASLPATSPALPSGTIAPQTRTDGPYLVFLRDRGHGQELVLMDADGKGQRVFPFSVNTNVYIPRSLSNLVSPDGNWLAFYTGSAGSGLGRTGSAGSDLALNLVSLGSASPASNTKVLSRLLSADYPANFVQAARELGRTDISAQTLQDAFVNGITQSIAWSPDGSRLAFAGQMDGLSSDLYLYDSLHGTIQRLSSGPEEVQWIDWSPDGKWILDASSYWVGEGMTYNLYATTLDGQVIRRLLVDHGLAGGLTWVNAHAFLTYQNQNGRGNFGLVRVDVESGRVDKIWDGSFDSFALDTAGAWLALHAGAGGLALIDLGTLRSTTVQFPDPARDYGAGQDILSLDSGPERAFLTRDDSSHDPLAGLYYVSINGRLTSAGTAADIFSVAPNHKDWIAIQDSIQLFTAGSSQARTFNLPAGKNSRDFQQILWRPDSSGIFLAGSAGQLYALDFSSGISTLVEQNLSPADPVAGVPAGLIWVRK